MKLKKILNIVFEEVFLVSPVKMLIAVLRATAENVEDMGRSASFF